MKKIITLLLFFSCSCLLAKDKEKPKKANLNQKIGEFFDKYNTVPNTSSPELINSQLGVHFLGGGGEVRTGVYDVNPIHVSLPTFTAGCGGIDYNLGGINIASKEEMKAALKSIATNSVGYAFMLGMETISPVVSSTAKQIQTWANQLNAMNLNSCELASSLVQGVWPKSQRASSYICEHSSTSDPLFRDLIEAKHGCRDDSDKRQFAMEGAQKNNKNILIENYNIAWKALEKSSLDKATKELFMNMSGTIVSKGGQNIHFYSPQYKKALDILKNGGEIKEAYHIGDNGIDINIAPIAIQPKDAWKSRIYNILISLQDKILREGKGESAKLNEQEINLIQTTRFPIGTLLSLMAQYNGQGGVLALDRYSEIIAFERVINFSEEVLRDTLKRAEALRAAQVDGYELENYVSQIKEVLSDLRHLNTENLQKIATEHQVFDYLMNIDQNLKERDRGV